MSGCGLIAVLALLPGGDHVTRPDPTAITIGVASAAVSAKPITVTVVAHEFSYTLSRRTVPRGATVRFVVRNAGAVPHDFVIGKRRTRILPPGGSQTITVRFQKAGRFAFLCSVAGHAKVGMKGTFGVARPVTTAPPPPPPPEVDSEAATLTRIGTFSRPVLVTAPPGDVDRIFVVEHAGRVVIVDRGTVRALPFLDIRSEVYLTNEPGFLSIAFAPDFPSSGLVYALYNMRRGNGDLRLAEYRVSPADPNVLDPTTGRTVLEIPKPWENHNGGMLQFGPDGMLYVSVGDGDSGILNRPGAFAQTRVELLGNILRIDPRGGTPYAVPADNPFVGDPASRPEVWAFGLRNPWRFWIDALTKTMYIGDVGLGKAEEIDAAPLAPGGRNFGWPCFEGTKPFDSTASCPSPIPPTWDAPHDDGSCSIIAGVVIRDPRLPSLAGKLVHGDYCTGELAALSRPASLSGAASSSPLGLRLPALSSFGIDGLHRVYAMSTDGGVYRLDPAAR